LKPGRKVSGIGEDSASWDDEGGSSESDSMGGYQGKAKRSSTNVK